MMSKLVVCAAGAVALAAGLYARQRGHEVLGTNEKSDHKVQEGASGFPQSSDRKQDMQVDRLSPEGCEQEREAHSILKLKYAAMKKKYDEMKEEHDKLRKSHDEMQQKNDEMKKYHAEMMIKKNNEIKKNHDEMKKNHDEIKEKYKETKKNHGEMKKKHDEMKQRHGEMKKNHDELKEKYEETKKNHDEMKEELDEMKEKHDEIKERHAEMKQKCDKMKQKYEEMKKNHDMKKKHKMKEKHDEMKKYNEMKDELQKVQVALAKAEENAQNALQSNTQLELKNANLMQQVESLQGVMETLQRQRLTVNSRSNKLRRVEEMEKREDHSVLLSQDEDVKSQEKSHRGTADGPPSAPLLPANLKWSDLFEASLPPEATPTLELEKKHGFEERGDCKLEIDTTPERQPTWRRRAERVRADAAKKNEKIDCVQKEKKKEERFPRLQRNSRPRRRSRRRRLKMIPA